MELGLKGKVAIVTGPAKGMGAAITLRAGEARASTSVLAGRDMAAIAPVAAEVREIGPQSRSQRNATSPTRPRSKRW